MRLMQQRDEWHGPLGLVGWGGPALRRRAWWLRLWRRLTGPGRDAVQRMVAAQFRRARRRRAVRRAVERVLGRGRQP